MLTFYLVMIASGQYLGPFPQSTCQMAAAALTASGVVCRQASVMTLCPVPEHPEAFTSCPVFDSVKIKSD